MTSSGKSNLRVIVARNLKAARNRLGLSQQQLAEMAGLSTNFVAMIEVGKRLPSLDVIVTLSEYLGIKPYELLYEEARSDFDVESTIRLLRLFQAKLTGGIETTVRDLIAALEEQGHKDDPDAP